MDNPVIELVQTANKWLLENGSTIIMGSLFTVTFIGVTVAAFRFIRKKLPDKAGAMFASVAQASSEGLWNFSTRYSSPTYSVFEEAHKEQEIEKCSPFIVNDTPVYTSHKPSKFRKLKDRSISKRQLEFDFAEARNFVYLAPPSVVQTTLDFSGIDNTIDEFIIDDWYELANNKSKLRQMWPYICLFTFE